MAKLDDLSVSVNELYRSIAVQLIINADMLVEIKKFGDRSSASEISTTFIEYRKTLHERFGIIHQQIGHIDMAVEALMNRVIALDQAVQRDRVESLWSMAVFFSLVVGASVMISNYGMTLVRLIIPLS